MLTLYFCPVLDFLATRPKKLRLNLAKKTVDFDRTLPLYWNAELNFEDETYPQKSIEENRRHGQLEF
jgi:hypothetical protein